MFCPNCGNRVNEQDAFCEKCGARIVMDDMDETVTQVGVPQYGEPGYGGYEYGGQDEWSPEYGQQYYGAPGYGGQDGWDQPPGPRQKKKFPIIMVGVIVFILAVVGFAVWFLLGDYFHSDSDNDETTATTQTQEMTTEDSYSSDEDYDSSSDEPTVTKPREELSGSGHEDDIIPYSSDRLLTDSDLSGLTKKEIQYAINEIYARHGAQFEDKDVIQYFSAKSWYSPNKSKSEAHSDFSKIESENTDFMTEYIKYL